MTVVGTRPEIIRLACVIQRLDDEPGVDHTLVHTGQNHDVQLSDVFFSDLNLRPPDFFLEADTSSLGSMLGDIFRGTEAVLDSVDPEAFLVLGDTNSAMSLVMAKRKHIPTYHMEAGNRCFDANVPEEINRRLVDHTADFNLVYTEHGRRNLLMEGIEPRRILLTGSPLREVLNHYRLEISQSMVVQNLQLSSSGYFVVSAHRQENVDNAERLDALVRSINLLAESFQIPIVFSLHPRTQQRLAAMRSLKLHPLVRMHQPFGFLDFIQLQIEAKCVVSDSGTVSEEAAILGFPAVTLRPAIERPEALDSGAISLVDVDPERVLAGVQRAIDRKDAREVPVDYLIGNTSERVVNFILSTAPQHQEWSGLRG